MTFKELQGIAVGFMGMSRQDFLCLTLEEFNCIVEKWNEREQAHSRTTWEQVRFIAHCVLTPYSKKRLDPTDIVLFEWEKTKPKEVATQEDFERVKKKYG